MDKNQKHRTQYANYYFVTILQVQQPNVLSEIDLDLVSTQQTIEQLKLGSGEKPQLSEKALNRISRRSRYASPAPSAGMVTQYSSPTSAGTSSDGMSKSLDKIGGVYIHTYICTELPLIRPPLGPVQSVQILMYNT